MDKNEWNRFESWAADNLDKLKRQGKDYIDYMWIGWQARANLPTQTNQPSLYKSGGAIDTNHIGDVNKLAEENKRLREALEFYAKAWKVEVTYSNYPESRSYDCFDDNGKVARKALNPDKPPHA